MLAFISRKSKKPSYSCYYHQYKYAYRWYLHILKIYEIKKGKNEVVSNTKS